MKNNKQEKELEEMENLSDQIELSNLNLGILIRTEAVNIISNILNAWLNVKQKSTIPVGKEELQAIQAQINEENKITRDMYNQLYNKLNPQVNEKETQNN